MTKINYKSHKGFTLIELLVVIGILAVLAAIAIPSVAGLIDRANVSADKTNSNEMTNAIERFASEYELYCQDIASGAITSSTTDFDSAQGRVYNVTGAKTRSDIETLEVAQNATITDDMIAIYRDTKYPVNAKTMQLVVQNYTKTSSSTFEPKQSDMHYWYSPDCGVVVFAEPNANTDVEKYLNSQIISGMDAKGNPVGADTKWIDLTLETFANNNAPPVQEPETQTPVTFVLNGTTYQTEEGTTWEQWLSSVNNTSSLSVDGNYIYNGSKRLRVNENVYAYTDGQGWSSIMFYDVKPQDKIFNISYTFSNSPHPIDTVSAPSVGSDGNYYVISDDNTLVQITPEEVYW